jgi:hypothetical protein
MRAAPIPDSYWVKEGKLLAGEYPGAADADAALQKLQRIREAGVDFFLDLTEAGEGLRPYEAAVAPLEYRRMPIRDLGLPSSGEMIAILDEIDRAIADGRCVYVHCWGGIGRTGTVVGCWLVRHGRTPDDALDQIALWRSQTPDGWRRSPETDEQHAFVGAWRQRT